MSPKDFAVLSENMDPSLKFIRPAAKISRHANPKKQSACMQVFSWITESLVEPIFATLDRKVAR